VLLLHRMRQGCQIRTRSKSRQDILRISLLLSSSQQNLEELTLVATGQILADLLHEKVLTTKLVL